MKKEGFFYVVATPIGNLKDITIRALEVFKSVNLILSEDTRVTQKILSSYGIKCPLRRYDEYSKPEIYREIKNRIQSGESIALVSDAGTPGVSDPGSKIVNYLRSESLGAKVIPIPGASALTSILSVSGISSQEFVFLGYPPHKKGREKFFNSLESMKIRPIILYESPYRIEKTLKSIGKVFGDDCPVLVGRELTKIHEEVFNGRVRDAQEYFLGEHKKGEFVLVIP